MNIFILDKKHQDNAKRYCDKHLIKMILETTQILCSVAHLHGIEAPYKLTHKNHPCVKWTNQSSHNWDYLMDLVDALNTEYKFRFNKSVNHKSYDVAINLMKPKLNNSDNNLYCIVTDIVSTGDIDNTILAYRKYYNKKFSEIKMSWTNRPVPEFIKGE